MATLTRTTSVAVERANFTFASTSPFILKNLLANDEINEVQVVITTPFNDAAATLRIGTVGSPDLIFAANELNTQLVRQFLNKESFEVATAEVLRMLISPGTSTQGAGYILFRIRR